MKRQHGTTLIEVLVTVLILATSLLAMAALQTRSLSNNHSAYMRSQANIFAYDIVDRIRIATPSAEGALVVPSDDDLTLIVSSLPEGDANIECEPVPNNRVCTISVIWSEQDGTDVGGETSTFAYTTRI